MRKAKQLRTVLLTLLSVAMAGCGVGNFAAVHGGQPQFSVSPATAVLSTNSHVQLRTSVAGGAQGQVEWSVTGGDQGGPGTITSDGLYTPPAAIYGRVSEVVVTARRKDEGAAETAKTDTDTSGAKKEAARNETVALARLTVTAGFLRPLSPENATVSPGSLLPLSAVVARVGGGKIEWLLASDPQGKSVLPPGYGQINAAHGGKCDSGGDRYTVCGATYAAPPVLPQGEGNVYAVARIAGTENTQAAQLLMSAALSSSPAAHQSTQAGAVKLGSSGGNAYDYDTDAAGNVLDCCGGTLGALLEGSDGKQYVLSTNHVLANSDRARPGDAIVQPALIDSNCEPTHSNTMATLRYAPSLADKATNTDAAVAVVNDRENKLMEVDASGAILELGAADARGMLSAAPPARGSGEAVTTAHVPLRVAKSGRSTGLTCAPVKAIEMSVAVPYYRDCAETQPSRVKRFDGQVLIGQAGAKGGSKFSDITGDSGALLVDQANAEPVGLLYAANAAGALANPVGDVLRDLERESGGTSFQFAGGEEHAVACLEYGTGHEASSLRTPSAEVEMAAASAVAEARRMLGAEATAAAGVSTDAEGEAAVILRPTRGKEHVRVPGTIAGVRTVVEREGKGSGAAEWALPRQVVDAAVAVKQRYAQRWMVDAAVLGVGVAQSRDDPEAAAVLVLLEEGKTPGFLPKLVDGVRVRYEYADPFHTSHGRSYGEGRVRSCSVRAAALPE